MKTAEELRDGSEHIYYEIWMLESMTRLLMLTDELLSQAIRNALLNSFLTHFRSIADFLCDMGRREDDMRVGEYSDNYVVSSDFKDWWDGSSTGPSRRDRVGKEIMHLTWARLPDGHPKKGWDFPRIQEEIEREFKSFLNGVPEERLCPGLLERKRECF